MSKILEIQNLLGKSKWKEVVADLKTFTKKGCKITAQKKGSFLADFPLQRMRETSLPDGLETSGRRGIAHFVISLDFLSFCVFNVFFFFTFSKKIVFL